MSNDGGQGQSGSMEGEGSGQVAIWKMELMGLADGLGVEVKGESPWGLSSSDRKSKFRKQIISSVRACE